MPFNSDLLATIFNWALRANFEDVMGVEIPADSEARMTISGIVCVRGFDSESGNLRSYREHRNLLALATNLLDRRKIKKKDIEKWMRQNDEWFQKIVAVSDMYARIDVIEELYINFRLVRISGQGYVILKNPERFPTIFSRDSEADCCFLYLEGRIDAERAS